VPVVATVISAVCKEITQLSPEPEVTVVPTSIPACVRIISLTSGGDPVVTRVVPVVDEMLKVTSGVYFPAGH